MISFHLPNGRGEVLRVLCLGAHSDDIEIGCGGTMLHLLGSGKEVEVFWIVFGAPGVRGEEARSSAAKFLEGAKRADVRVYEFRDGFFPFHGEAIKEIFEQLKSEFDPHVIFTHTLNDRHQDHRLISDLTWNTYRDHLILEYEVPKYDGDLGTPSVFFPIQDLVCRRKIALIMESFESQKQKHWFTEDTFSSLMRLRGIESAARGKYAEAFYVRKILLRT